MFNGGQRFDDFGRSHIIDQESFIDAPGVLMKKVVPADNSCLFTSVGYVLNGEYKHQGREFRWSNVNLNIFQIFWKKDKQQICTTIIMVTSDNNSSVISRKGWYELRQLHEGDHSECSGCGSGGIFWSISWEAQCRVLQMDPQTRFLGWCHRTIDPIQVLRFRDSGDRQHQRDYQ